MCSLLIRRFNPHFFPVLVGFGLPLAVAHDPMFYNFPTADFCIIDTGLITFVYHGFRSTPISTLIELPPMLAYPPAESKFS